MKNNNRHFETVKKCDLCGKNIFSHFITVKDLNFRTGIFTYVKCENCKLICLSPRPTQNILSEFYPLTYRAYQATKEPTKGQKFVRNIIKKYRFAAKLLIKDPLFFCQPKGKILDVGAGNGDYMKILSSWGWKTYGVEMNSLSASNAKLSGVKNITVGNFEKIKLQNESFGIVNFTQVLEHVASPSKVLEKVHGILKKNGRVIIKIPNINSLFFKLFKSYWYPLEAPRHFYQFSPETITLLLKKNGFRDIKITYNQSTYTFLWSLFYLLGLKKAEKKFGYLTYPLSLIIRPLNYLKMADVMEITAEKSSGVKS